MPTRKPPPKPAAKSKPAAKPAAPKVAPTQSAKKAAPSRVATNKTGQRLKPTPPAKPLTKPVPPKTAPTTPNRSKSGQTEPNRAKATRESRAIPESNAAKPRRGVGRPPHLPDKASQQRVLAWSGGGISHDMIAESLGIDRNTLAKHYREQLSIGKAMMDGLAISTLALAMQRGGKEAVIAAKWWTQSQMGWSERLVVDDGKVGDTPMRVIIELVGEAPTLDHRPARPRAGFDPSIVELIG